MPSAVLRRAHGAPALNARRVRALADQMLVELGLQSAELSVLLTDDDRIRELNKRHRGKDKPTDVLAFPLVAPKLARAASGSDGRDVPPHALGDVVISLNTAERQARGRRRELLAEVRFLLAHGLLHLLGYDHRTPAQKRRMDARARRLVRAAPLPVSTPERRITKNDGPRLISAERPKSSRRRAGSALVPR